MCISVHCYVFRQISTLEKPCSGTAYYCFKSTIRPNWDDVNNVNGGRWAIDVSRQEVPVLLDFYWLSLLLALLLDRFGELDDCICGAVVRYKRKRCKVSYFLEGLTSRLLRD